MKMTTMVARTLMPIRLTILTLLLIGMLLPSTAERAAAEMNDKGEVTLPLAEYLKLSQAARTAQRVQEPELRLVELVSEHTRLRVDGASVMVRGEYVIEVRGVPERAVVLPLTGFGHQVRVERTDGAAASTRGGVGASVHRQDGEILFVADSPGSYRVVVEGRDLLTGSWMEIAEIQAPVATLFLDLPADHKWTCNRAVVVSERTVAETAGAAARIHVEMALEQGERYNLSVDRRGAQVEEEVLAHSVGVTFVEVDRSGVRRHDVLATEVLRGDLQGYRVTLPPGLDLEAVATDEGEVVPWIGDDGKLDVRREQRLAGHGYLALTSRRLAAETGDGSTTRVDLTPVVAEIPQRTRYLVLLASAAADVVPQPQDQWLRVDQSDLPVPLHQDMEALRPASVWRAVDPAQGGELLVHRLPEVSTAEQVISERQSVSLLTLDGSLVLRDRFRVRGRAATLDIELPADVQLWTVSVDDEAVRPLHRALQQPGAEAGQPQLYSIPLGFRAGLAAADLGQDVWVEVVAVRTLAQGAPASTRGHSNLRLELASVTVPVLMHDWRVLLPQGARYRYAGGELLPIADLTAPVDRGWSWSPRRTKEVPTQVVERGLGNVRAVVKDGNGDTLPGVTVTLTLRGGELERSALTNENGQATVLNLQPGQYRLVAQLEGFTTVEHYLQVRSGQLAETNVELPLSALEESIVVSAESARYYDNTFLLDEIEIGQAARDADLVQAEYGQMSQGLAGGAKPLPVTVPESGKILELGGVLPPARVSVELEVRAER